MRCRVLRPFTLDGRRVVGGDELELGAAWARALTGAGEVELLEALEGEGEDEGEESPAEPHRPPSPALPGRRGHRVGCKCPVCARRRQKALQAG